MAARQRSAASDAGWAFGGTIGSAIDITDLKTARATLSNLNRRLIEAQEQERSRLARELHGDVGQQGARRSERPCRSRRTDPTHWSRSLASAMRNQDREVVRKRFELADISTRR
jgi:glucose-6-phosphate-specific signal transduction histidine kinase